MNFRKHCLTGTLIYLGASFVMWLVGPVPVFLLALCSLVYMGSGLVFAFMCLHDFKKDLRVVCPHHYRNWDTYMRENDFRPARQREILADIRKEMLQSPHKTDQTERVVEEIDWITTALPLQFIVMVVDLIVMAASRAVYRSPRCFSWQIGAIRRRKYWNSTRSIHKVPVSKEPL